MLRTASAALLIMTLLLASHCTAVSVGYEIVSRPTTHYTLNTTGYRYILLYMRLNVSLMHPYQYILVHLATRGIYAYGYALVYDPDTGPMLYIMAGSQNSWYNASAVMFNESITLWMLLDTANGTIYAYVNGTLRVLNKTIPVNITGLDIEAGTIEEQETPYIVFADPLIAAATGENITEALLGNTPPWNETTILLNKSLAITNTELPQPGGTGGGEEHTVSENATVIEEPPAVAQYVSLILIAAGAAVILAVYMATHRGSPGEAPAEPM